MILKAITLFLLIISSDCFAVDEISSRFGTLQVVDTNKVKFNNQLLLLEPYEDREVDLVQIFNFTDHDIVLVKRKGNESCAVDFNLVVVSELGANATESFGTCLNFTDAYKNENSVVIIMPMNTTGMFKKVTYTNDFPTKTTELAGKRKPRIKFIGARTKDYRLAIYSAKWNQLLEEKSLNDETLKKLGETGAYGSIQLTVSINSDGSIHNIETNKSSGNNQLDEAIINFVRKSSPFDKFSEEILKDADILSITRTFTYTREFKYNN